MPQMPNTPVVSKMSCVVAGCDKYAASRGMCSMHYARELRSGRLERVRLRDRVCSVDGCNGKHDARGLCAKHYSAAYHKEHQAAINARHSAHVKQYPEKKRASSKAWRERNRDRDRAHSLAWAKKNPRKARLRERRHTLRKRNAVGTHTYQEVMALLLKQKRRCAICRVKFKGNAFHEDHIIALACGGSDWIHNIQLLCARCNCSKQAKDPIVYMQARGFLI